MTPSIGRIVHYVDNDGEHRAAIIVRTYPSGNALSPVAEHVGLQVFLLTGTVPLARVEHQEIEGTRRTEYTPGTWHWPERV